MCSGERSSSAKGAIALRASAAWGWSTSRRRVLSDWTMRGPSFTWRVYGCGGIPKVSTFPGGSRVVYATGCASLPRYLGNSAAGYPRRMNSPRFWLGVALVLIGAVWFGQGMGWIGGGAMSGVALWAIVGPVVALIGIALALQAVRAKR